jgi:hypothetical protein
MRGSPNNIGCFVTQAAAWTVPDLLVTRTSVWTHPLAFAGLGKTDQPRLGRPPHGMCPLIELSPRMRCRRCPGPAWAGSRGHLSGTLYRRSLCASVQFRYGPLAVAIGAVTVDPVIIPAAAAATTSARSRCCASFMTSSPEI